MAQLITSLYGTVSCMNTFRIIIRYGDDDDVVVMSSKLTSRHSYFMILLINVKQNNISSAQLFSSLPLIILFIVGC